MRKQLTCEQALALALPLKGDVFQDSNMGLFGSYAELATRSIEICKWLSSQCWTRYAFRLPDLGLSPAGAEMASLPHKEVHRIMTEYRDNFIRDVDAALRDGAAGRVTWTGKDTCQFTYGDVAVKRGFLNDTTNRTICVSHLIKAHEWMLPCDHVAMPHEAVAALNSMPLPLKGVCRIVTGVKVLGEMSAGTTTVELNSRGRFTKDVVDSFTGAAKRTGRFARENAGTIGKATAGIAGAGLLAGLGAWAISALSAAATVATTAAQVAVIDPAIVIGDLVIFGWED